MYFYLSILVPPSKSIGKSTSMKLNQMFELLSPICEDLNSIRLCVNIYREIYNEERGANLQIV